MFEIRGKYNTALCYAEIIEEEAIEQLQRMVDQEFTAGSRLRIMPDVHAGHGCTIGTTMTVKDKAVPNFVGVDIGCGMYTVELGNQEIDFAAVDAAAHAMPSGFHVWESEREFFPLEDLRCFDRLENIGRLRKSLGTLGGGNHFIEIDRSEDGRYYLIIHSGSRNLGKQVAEYYQETAVNQHSGRKDYLVERDELIARLKAEGRQKEIQGALQELQVSWLAKKPDMPADLCYLYGELFRDYMHDIEICQRFARRSRELMAEFIMQSAGLSAVSAFHTIHNYIDTEEMVLRKGAISAHRGELVLIPLNMKDGCILAVGKGNPEWNESAPHGAGRVMSRTRARHVLSLQDYQDEMQGIYTTSVNAETLDEAPQAYKPQEAILNVINETVEVREILKPVYNFKASE